MAQADSIWKRDLSIDALNTRSKNSNAEHLGISFDAIGKDYLSASMPIDARTRQPLGLLNGGASAALVENVASVAANYCVRPPSYCLGTQVIANHLRPAREGRVTAVARPLHLGRSTQLWEVMIHDLQQRLICAARMSMAVLQHPDQNG